MEERHESEESSPSNRKRSQSVTDRALEAFTICTAVVDQQGQITDVQGTALNRWGAPAKDLVGKNMAEVAPDLAEAVEKARAGERVEYVLETTNEGLPAFYSNIVEKIDDPEGAVVCYSLDITARIWMENSLKDTVREFQEQSRILEAVFNCMAEGVVVTDPHGNYLFRNPAADRILGLGSNVALDDQPELEGAYFPDQKTILTDEDQPLTAALRGETCHQLEIYLKNPHIPNGANLVVSSQPLRNEETGDLIGALGVFHDISERKQMEEGRILLERKMAQAGKLATVGQLADGIANEINDLLQVINGFCEMLADAVELEGDLLDYVGHIQSASDRCGSIVNQLLALAKQDQDSRDPVLLNSCVKEVCDFLTHQFQLENIKLECHFARKLDPILANEGELQQVLFHLLINAMDAMSSGGSITVSTAQIGNRVRLLIRDTGEGIPEENLGRIFDPFFTTKAGQSGPGLGLAIVSAVVERLDGTIKVESKVSAGTSFLLEFPCTFNEAKESAGAENLHHLIPLRVLVVDNEPLVRSLCAVFLNSDGHSVFQAANAEEALDMTQANSYDLILLDLAMPGMGGRSLIDKLRVAGDRTPILIMTGRVEDPVGDPRELDKVIGILRKPFQKSTLREIIAKIHSEKMDTAQTDTAQIGRAHV